MLTFETINELTLKVTCSGSDVLFAKAGAFVAGSNTGAKNYSFEKLLLGPQGNIGQALLGQLVRRVAGENLPLMKVNLNGDSVTYYANYGQHVVIYHLEKGETVSVESENILAFTALIFSVSVIKQNLYQILKILSVNLFMKIFTDMITGQYLFPLFTNQRGESLTLYIFRLVEE